MAKSRPSGHYTEKYFHMHSPYSWMFAKKDVNPIQFNQEEELLGIWH